MVWNFKMQFQPLKIAKSYREAIFLKKISKETMKKIQKMGFIISNSIFILLGIIFLVIGIIAEDRTLKIMGACWLPLGILSLLLVLHLLKKEK
jgi:hypothetical protein